MFRAVMLEALRRDARRYESLGGWATHVGFWVGATYRFGVWAHAGPPVVRQLPLTLYRLVRLLWRLFLNVSIPAAARIGPGLCLIHPHNILVGHDVVIGEDCLIFHEVTIGMGPRPGVPSIGDGVDLYVGARVLGGVSIGSRSMVGANCVVVRDVPADAIVASPPTRVLPRSLSGVARTADGLRPER